MFCVLEGTIAHVTNIIHRIILSNKTFYRVHLSAKLQNNNNIRHGIIDIIKVMIGK